MNKQKIVLRLLVSPFVFCLMFTTYLFHSFKHFFKYILYGAELIVYEKEDPKRMEDIFKLLKEQNNEKIQPK